MHFFSQLEVCIGVKYEGRQWGVCRGRWIMGIVCMYLRKTASFSPI